MYELIKRKCDNMYIQRHNHQQEKTNKEYNICLI